MPSDHPLRAIKRPVDAVLQKLSPLFDALYGREGRPGLPPEQRLKARLLTALDSPRRRRLLRQQPGDNLSGFLDRHFSKGSFDHSVFAKNFQEVLPADVARLFFAEVSKPSPQAGWARITNTSPPTAR